MIKIQDLIDGHPDFALWHGTKSNITGSLKSGDEIIGKAKESIRNIWGKIAEERNILISEIRSENAPEFFSGPIADNNAVDLGNTIRYLNKDFDYSGIAFALWKTAALECAKNGSELANGIISLIEASRESYPKFFDNQSIKAELKSALSIANGLTAGTGKVLRLIKLPRNGFFWDPRDNSKSKVNVLSRMPFENDIISYSELFFSESIPLDHFEIEEVKVA